MGEPRKRIDTVIGSVAVVPECKLQATCTNGSKCWEAGECLRAPGPADVVPVEHDLRTVRAVCEGKGVDAASKVSVIWGADW